MPKKYTLYRLRRLQESEAALRAAELRAIQDEGPLYNIASSHRTPAGSHRLQEKKQETPKIMGTEYVQQRVRVVRHPEQEVYVRVPSDFPGCYYITGQKATSGIRTVLRHDCRELLGYSPNSESVSLNNALAAWEQYKARKLR